MNKPKTIDNSEFKKKVIKTFVHGFLHLLGYNHLKFKDFKKMTKEEEKLNKIIIKNISKLA